jgi:hypothetical protein
MTLGTHDNEEWDVMGMQWDNGQAFCFLLCFE